MFLWTHWDRQALCERGSKLHTELIEEIFDNFCDAAKNYFHNEAFDAMNDSEEIEHFVERYWFIIFLGMRQFSSEYSYNHWTDIDTTDNLRCLEDPENKAFFKNILLISHDIRDLSKDSNRSKIIVAKWSGVCRASGSAQVNIWDDDIAKWILVERKTKIERQII